MNMEISRHFTARNLKIIDEFVSHASPSADGILLSGSNAWGANYAVTATSDIDLLVTGTMEQLRAVVEALVSKGIIDVKERERFEVFRNLYLQKRAEQFSTISTGREVKLSLDLLPIEVVVDICAIHPMTTRQVEGLSVRTVKEFRINKPNDDGYSVDDLKGLKKLTYHPHFEEVKNVDNNVIGYLADTLVDAQTESTYALGVMSFFFAVHPVILFDKGGKLQNAIKTLQAGIARRLGAQVPSYITRQERMSEEILKEVKRTLSQVQDKSGI
jgi:hypothetical protein